MRRFTELLDFLTDKMSMTDLYQPAVILHLLGTGGHATKAELARTLSGYDENVQKEYEEIVMRWPKITLTSHNVIEYDQKNRQFTLNFDLTDNALVERAKSICEDKIRQWIEKKVQKAKIPRSEASIRYRVLKAARQKCQLCGISSSISPIDIDHIIPTNKADKAQNVILHGVKMHVDDERNLQALCAKCNRAKRDQDTTDFRPSQQKLVRDRIPEVITASGRVAVVKQIQGDKLKEQLFEKLTEEHAELLEKPELDEIADMMEVLFSIAQTLGHSEEQALLAVREKRAQFGGFNKGVFLTSVQDSASQL